jgi:hypothetical protein
LHNPGNCYLLIRLGGQETKYLIPDDGHIMLLQSGLTLDFKFCPECGTCLPEADKTPHQFDQLEAETLKPFFVSAVSGTDSLHYLTNAKNQTHAVELAQSSRAGNLLAVETEELPALDKPWVRRV